MILGVDTCFLGSVEPCASGTRKVVRDPAGGSVRDPARYEGTGSRKSLCAGNARPVRASLIAYMEHMDPIGQLWVGARSFDFLMVL